MTDPLRYHINTNWDLNEDQWEVLESILNTFLGELTDEEAQKLADKYSKGPDGADRQALLDFAKLKSTDLGSRKLVQGFLNRAVAPEKRTEILLVFTLLSTRAGTFALTGHFTPFKDLTRKEREACILSWRDSYIPRLRLLYKAFASLSLNSIYGKNQCDALHRAMTYPARDVERSHSDYEPVNQHPRIPMLTEQELLNSHRFDAIVIGTGCGGGVAAAELSKAGKKVLVIEKGTYYHESDFILTENDAMANLYEAGGFFGTADGHVYVLAGSTFGGGTTVNWSACLKLQHFVREEWAKQGLTHFISPKFSKDLDRVFEKIGASTEGIEHNGGNQILKEGAQKLGYHYADLHQNTNGQKHPCAYCYAGCRDGIKNGTMNTYLRDAQENGAKFIDRTKVLKVITKNGQAVGVEVLINHGPQQRKAEIYADIVVCSAGSLQTPGVLLRSGLKNKHIGKHLRLHPCAIPFGFFDKVIKNYEGSIMTAVSHVVENVDGDGYGAKLEVPSNNAASFATVVPWRSNANHKESMLRYRNYAPILVLSRDKDTNSAVRYDEHDNLAVDYDISTHDRQSILAGILKALDILVAAGAREVNSGQFSVEPFVFQEHEESRIDNPRYIAWRNNVERVGIPSFGSGLFAAHQMGTARMGISPKVSVVKPTGETWEVKNLYVCDTSVFPTASGVNPQVTTYAVAYHITDCIIKKDTINKAAKL